MFMMLSSFALTCGPALEVALVGLAAAALGYRLGVD
jgi:hypothetical protein